MIDTCVCGQTETVAAGNWASNGEVRKARSREETNDGLQLPSDAGSSRIRPVLS